MSGPGAMNSIRTNVIPAKAERAAQPLWALTRRAAIRLMVARIWSVMFGNGLIQYSNLILINQTMDEKIKTQALAVRCVAVPSTAISGAPVAPFAAGT